MRSLRLAHTALQLLRNSNQRKHIFRWLNSLQKNYFLHKKQPWIVFDAIDFLNSLPLEGKWVFEYGSGGSTLYWLSRKMKCVSIEHDPYWYSKVRTQLNSYVDVDYRLIQPEEFNISTKYDLDDPALYLSGDSSLQGLSFKKYVSQIDYFPDNFFDVILIDGRARPSCILHSISKVKIGGYIVLDNADRSYYITAHTAHSLIDYQCKLFYGVGPATMHPWQTNIYVRTHGQGEVT